MAVILKCHYIKRILKIINIYRMLKLSAYSNMNFENAILL